MTREHIEDFLAPGVQPYRVPDMFNINALVPLPWAASPDPPYLHSELTESMHYLLPPISQRQTTLDAAEDSGWPEGREPAPLPSMPPLPLGDDFDGDEGDDSDDGDPEHASDLHPSGLLGFHRTVAPTIEIARAALKDLDTEFYEQHGKRRVERQLNPWTRSRMLCMRGFLNFYVHKELSETYGHWGASSVQAALMMMRGRYCARVLRRMTRHYIETREILAVNPYGGWTVSALCDQDLCHDLQCHLVELGTNITAEKIVQFLSQPEVMERHELRKPISIRTARRWLVFLGYRYRHEIRGQYVDGHEREDVVNYRDNHYIPKIQAVCSVVRTVYKS